MPDIHVANAAQARLLLTVELRPLLNALMRRPSSVTDLAETLSLDIQRTYYLIQKLLKAGVIEMGQEQRERRLTKVYWMPQPWFIPYRVTAAETLEPFVSAQVQPRIEVLIKRIIQVYVNKTGEGRGFWLSDEGLSLGDTTGAAQHLWEGDEDVIFTLGHINLSPEKVKEFKRYLLTLASEDDVDSRPQRQGYAFAMLVVPSTRPPAKVT